MQRPACSFRSNNLGGISECCLPKSEPPDEDETSLRQPALKSSVELLGAFYIPTFYYYTVLVIGVLLNCREKMIF